MNKILRKTFIVVIALFFIGCKIPIKTMGQTYEEIMNDCKANPEIKRGTTIDGQTISMKWIPEECIVGAPMPIFKTQTINGEKIDAAYFKNKMTIIIFWFEGCPPCIAKMPALNKLKDKYGSKKINFLAIGKDSKEDIVSFLKENTFNFDMVANGESINREVFQSPWGYPLTITVNKKGVIIDAYSGGKTETTFPKIETLIVKELGLKK